MRFTSWLNEYYPEKGPIKWLAFLFELIGSLALFGLMALTCADVVGRYFLHHPVQGATELTEVGLAIVIFSVMPIITWRGGHIVVDLIDQYLGQGLLKVLAWTSTLLVSISLYFVAFRVFELGARNLKRGIVTDFLYIPTGYIIQYIAVFSWITAAGLLLYTLVNSIRK